MTRNIHNHVKDAISKHKCNKRSNLNICGILLRSGNINKCAEYLLSSRKHSPSCTHDIINLFERMFKWSLFRIILFCATNDIPFMRDFAPADHVMGCCKSMECYQCVLCYEYNILYTGFRHSANRYLISIIKKIDAFYSAYASDRAVEFINVLFNMAVTYENIKIFKFVLYHYADRISVGDINNVIRDIYDKRETINIDFLTLSLGSLIKYVGNNSRIRGLVSQIPENRFDETAGIWREIVHSRIFLYKSDITEGTELCADIANIINQYNYINPDIRVYL